MAWWAIWFRGSSPLARGLPRRGDGGDGQQLDHPRSRGVYSSWFTVMPSASGSSPLARGLPARPHDHVHGGGIIPARAGFTLAGLVDPRLGEDHPRSRGVYPGWRGVEIHYAGSSPLARGLPTQTISDLKAHKDHPRSRGVYAVASLAVWAASGSSPLARGLR